MQQRVEHQHNDTCESRRLDYSLSLGQLHLAWIAADRAVQHHPSATAGLPLPPAPAAAASALPPAPDYFPSLHVARTKRAAICRQFKEGHCDDGDYCNYQHPTLLESSPSFLSMREIPCDINNVRAPGYIRFPSGDHCRQLIPAEASHLCGLTSLSYGCTIYPSYPLKIGRVMSRPPEMKLGGINTDVCPEAIATLVSFLTGAKVIAINLFTKGMGRCSIWLDLFDKSAEQKITFAADCREKINAQVVWMGPIHFGRAIIATDLDSQAFLLQMLAKLKENHSRNRFPTHILTAEPWIEEPRNHNKVDESTVSLRR